MGQPQKKELHVPTLMQPPDAMGLFHSFSDEEK